MTVDQHVHPADVLAEQLDRVAGLVRTLGDLYSPKSESFAAGNTFIAHGLVAVSTLVNDAQAALEGLHEVCDLRVVASPSDTTASVDVEEDQPMVFPPAETQWQPVETVVETEHPSAAVVTIMPKPAAEDTEFAQSYLELLRKLTAAEVFAAEQQALAPPGSGQNLLPLLRSLREEFQKLHRVA